MAKVNYSTLVADVAGKVGNVVFQRGKAGPIVRSRVIPINPKSLSQSLVRSRMTVRSKAWASLSESQRSSWDSAAASASWTQTDTFGNSFQLSGEQLYIKLNLVIASVGGSAIASPPSKASFAAIAIGTVTAAAGTPAISMPYTGTLGGNDYLVVSASAQVSAGIMSSKSVAFKQIAEVQSATPINLLTAYTSEHGALVAGNKIWFSVAHVNELTGEAVDLGTVSVVIGA